MKQRRQQFLEIVIRLKAKANSGVNKVTSSSTSILFLVVVFYTNREVVFYVYVGVFNPILFFFLISEEIQSKKPLRRGPLLLSGQNWLIYSFLKQYLQQIIFYRLWFTSWSWSWSLEPPLLKGSHIQRKLDIWTKLEFDLKGERSEWLLSKHLMASP